MINAVGARKIAFNLYPLEEPGDKLASALLDETRLKERGRTMRAYLVAGAALAAVDRRLPNIIAELAEENITWKDLSRIISSVIPDSFSADQAIVQAKLSRLNSQNMEEPIRQISESDHLTRTRLNSAAMFPDD